MVSVHGPGGEELSRYQYDASGKVVSQTVEENLLYLFYSKGQLSNELSEGVYSSYHQGAQGLTGRIVSNGEEKQYQLLLGTSQGSVIKTFSAAENETEREKETRRYTPYGEG